MTENIGKSDFTKISFRNACKRGLKHLIKLSPHTDQYAMALLLILKGVLKIFNPIAVNVEAISLTHEMLYFLHCSLRGISI